jgi:predicted nucleotidyltransferase
MKEPQNLTEIMAILQQQKNALQAKFGALDLAVFGSYVNHAQTQASDEEINVTGAAG